MFKELNNQIYIKIFIFLSWIALWVSINSMPGELLYMNQNIITFINGSRTINALFFSSFSIIIAIYYFLKNRGNINSFSILLLIFSIHFISQLIGLFFNPERSFFDINNIYLILYSLGTLSILYIIKNLNLEELFPYLMNFIFYVLIFTIIFILYNNKELIPEIINQKNLYYLIHPDIPVNYQAQPRITGFSRTISIINIFFIVYYLLNHKKIYSYFYFFPIFILSNIIWLSQSRGTIICFYLSSFILIFFFNNLSLLKKILFFILISFFSISSANFITNYNSNKYEIKNLENKNLESKSSENKNVETEFKNKEENLENVIDKRLEKVFGISESRFITQKNTSGRTELWKQSLKYYDKKIIFGYGPQADRIILFKKKNKYGNNVSNGSLYALLCGGYPSLISIIVVYLYSIYLFFTHFVKRRNFILTNENKFYVISITFCIFFMTRSLIENSFTLFSIDFLITILSMFIVESFIKNNKIIN